MKNLEKYLNEHLSGSGAALQLLLVMGRKNPADREIYDGLHQEILVNRRFLERVMAGANFARSRSMELAARATSRFVSWRFSKRGLEPGGLGLVEALEALELGIHGQSLLWRTLMEMPPEGAQTKGDYAALRERAERQKTVVERLRLEAVQQAFCANGHNAP